MNRAKNVFRTLLQSQKQPIRAPKKSKMTPKSSQIQRSELTETQKMKVLQLHEETQNQFTNLMPTPKIAHQGPKNSKLTPKLGQKQISELKVTKTKLLHYMSRPQNNLNPNPQNSLFCPPPKAKKRHGKNMVFCFLGQKIGYLKGWGQVQIVLGSTHILQ